MRVYRYRNYCICADYIIIFQTSTFRAKQHSNFLASRNSSRSFSHSVFWAKNWFCEIAWPGGGCHHESCISQSVRGCVKQACLIKQAPSPTGHYNRFLAGPAIARINNSHMVQAKVPHGPRSGANIFAHLWSNENDCGLLE